MAVRREPPSSKEWLKRRGRRMRRRVKGEREQRKSRKYMEELREKGEDGIQGRDIGEKGRSLRIKIEMG